MIERWEGDRPVVPPISNSHIDRTNSDLRRTRSPSVESRTMSIGFTQCWEPAWISTVVAPSSCPTGAYSRSGSMMMTSSSGRLSRTWWISDLPYIDLPDPEVPRKKALPFISVEREARIRFFDRAFTP